MRSLIILFAAILMSLTGCTKKSTTVDNSKNLIQPLSPETKIIEFTGGEISAKDLEDRMKPHLEKARESLFNAYLQEAEKLFIEQNQNRMNLEVNVTDEEVKQYVTANKIQAADAPKIRDFLLNEKLRLQKMQAVDELKKSMNVKNKLGAALFEVKKGKNSPSKGEDSAKVKAQVFCDFANGMCNRVRLVLGQAEAQYGQKFQWTYRHFPVASNPGSFDSAKIAICAHQQGKFWNAHEALSNLEGSLQGKDLKGAVSSTGLDMEELDRCLASRETESTLQEELSAALDIGITQTPTILINGQKVQDIDSIMNAISAQL